LIATITVVLTIRYAVLNSLPKKFVIIL